MISLRDGTRPDGPSWDTSWYDGSSLLSWYDLWWESHHGTTENQQTPGTVVKNLRKISPFSSKSNPARRLVKHLRGPNHFSKWALLIGSTFGDSRSPRDILKKIFRSSEFEKNTFEFVERSASECWRWVILRVRNSIKLALGKACGKSLSVSGW